LVRGPVTFLPANRDEGCVVAVVVVAVLVARDASRTEREWSGQEVTRRGVRAVADFPPNQSRTSLR
jgi:hypothetical protein